MNWRLIFALSGFGLLMAIATVYFIPSGIEIMYWLGIFGVSAWLIAKYAKGRFFLHGFMVSIFNSILVTAGHIVLSKDYLAHHAEEAQSYAKLYEVYKLSMINTMLLFCAFIGIAGGVVLGMMSSVMALVRLRAQQ